MKEITTIGLDIAKRILVAHGTDAAGNGLLRKKLRREEVHAFFASLPPCLVGMEARATAHCWAREIAALGHDTRLIPPSYVKAYVVRQKNDFVDAAAICEAVTRPSVRQTPIKTVEQQAARVAQRTHELLSRQRITLINALRGHMAEFGILAPAGPQHVGRLIERLADPATPIPSTVRDALNVSLTNSWLSAARSIGWKRRYAARVGRKKTPRVCSPYQASGRSLRARSSRACQTSKASAQVEISPHGLASCPGRTQAGGRSALDGSPKWATGQYGAYTETH